MYVRIILKSRHSPEYDLTLQNLSLDSPATTHYHLPNLSLKDWRAILFPSVQLH